MLYKVKQGITMVRVFEAVWKWFDKQGIKKKLPVPTDNLFIYATENESVNLLYI